MRVLIPVYPGAVSAAIVGTLDMLSHTRGFRDMLYPQDVAAPFFEPALASTTDSLVVVNFGFPVSCSSLLAQTGQADIVVVPAGVGDMQTMLADNPHLVAWLKAQHAGGALLCGNCTGTFFLAATGLLDGREATTSWFATDAFKQLFPKVILRDERILMDNGLIISAGATLSYINLCIYLIERFYGKALANYAAKIFLVDKSRDSQKAFSVFSSQRGHADKAILQAQDYIEQNPHTRIDLSELADQVALSERSFIRRFKAATGGTPSEYVQRAKVERAKHLLEAGENSVKEIGYDVGYEDASYFRDLFRRYTGLSPVAYRKMYVFG